MRDLHWLFGRTHRLYKRNGRNIRDVTHWFVDCCSEANSFESRQRHRENFRCRPGKKTNTDSTYMSMRRSHGRKYGWSQRRSGEVAIGCEGWISRSLVYQPVNHDIATPQCIPCFIVKYKIREAKIT